MPSDPGRRHAQPRDAGQGTLEYVGVVVLAVVLVAALVIAVNPGSRALAARMVCEVATLGQGSCDTPAPAPEDDDEGWWCRNVGWWCGDGTSREDEGATDDGDDGDGDDGDAWWCFLPWACDDDEDGDDEAQDEPTPAPSPTASAYPTDPATGLPVVDGVTIPKGVEPDEEAVTLMLLTQEGRETLQWLADQGIQVTFSFGGTFWRESEQTIYVDTSKLPHERIRSLAHEARHAREDAQGTSPDRATTTRDDYVARMLDEEARAVADEVVLARATRDAGGLSPSQASDTEYRKAYDAAVAAGQDGAAAHEAGVAAIRVLFENGHYRTSTTGEPYTEYYGQMWDKGQP